MLDLAPIPEANTNIPLVASNILASHDLRAIAAWVLSKRDSDHTRRAFRIEAQRWLAWLITTKADAGHQTFLDKATSEDAAAYALFLRQPLKPPFPQFALYRAGLHRQPFKGQALPCPDTPEKPLASATIERAISSLKAMYGDMMAMTLEGMKVSSNPYARFRTKGLISKGTPRTKALNEPERRYVDMALEQMRDNDDVHFYHQCRWIWSALLWTALRRDELARAKASDIFQDQDENGNLVWVIQVLGKGGTFTTLPLTEEFLTEFALYRAHHGLASRPTIANDGTPEATPLVLPIRGPMRFVSNETVYRAMKKLMKQAADIAVEQGNPGSAVRLRKFATHSARHTSITTLVDATGDITLGQDLARHASITTTRGYKAKSISRLKLAMQDLNKKF